MKKFLVIPIMILYLLAASGVLIHVHYCGNNLESWSVNSKSDGCEDEACENEQQKSDDCCKDKVIAAKVVQDQHLTDFVKINLLKDFFEPSASPNLFSIAFDCFPKAVFHHTIQPNAPPGRWQNIPLYKLHTQFTYYG
ncbi:MAG: hypothetical protein JSS78_11205 [Bacteroidetes bacterium]|nr:hypothetical protein [Bacteroidota bacterium]